MAAQNSDKLKKLSRKWVAQIGSGGVNDAVATTIPLSSVTNLPTDTAVVATIDRVDVNGTATPTLEETVIGVVSSTNLIDCVRGAEGTAQAHSAGAVVEILVTAKGYNDIIDHLLVQHNQDGTHKSALVTTLKASGAEINTGTEDGKIVTPKAIADSLLVNFIRKASSRVADSVNNPSGTLFAASAGTDPAVTLTTGTSVLVTVGARIVSEGNYNFIGFAVSGATTLTASDANAACLQVAGDVYIQRTMLITGLTAGSNTFTMQYKCNISASGSYSERQITVEGVN